MKNKKVKQKKRWLLVSFLKKGVKSQVVTCKFSFHVPCTIIVDAVKISQCCHNFFVESYFSENVWMKIIYKISKKSSRFHILKGSGWIFSHTGKVKLFKCRNQSRKIQMGPMNP